MAKNANDTEDDDNNATDDSSKTTEEDLRKLKYGDGEVETDSSDTSEDETTGSDETDEKSDDGGEEDGKTDDGATDGEEESQEEDSSEFVKELPNIKGETVPEYARNLESTIIESNKEGKRLADENAELKRQLATQGDTTDTGTSGGDSTGTAPDPTNTLELYAKQKLDQEIADAFGKFQKDYPQAVPGTPEYNAFTNEVSILSGTILQSQKRLASPEELYYKAAVILNWEKGSAPNSREKLGMAMKGQAAVSKTSSATKPVPKSKVTDDMIILNRRMYPGKTDDEIRKELEPFVK